jgi:hypothetical protein
LCFCRRRPSSIVAPNQIHQNGNLDGSHVEKPDEFQAALDAFLAARL